MQISRLHWSFLGYMSHTWRCMCEMQPRKGKMQSNKYTLSTMIQSFKAQSSSLSPGSLPSSPAWVWDLPCLPPLCLSSSYTLPYRPISTHRLDSRKATFCLSSCICKI